MRACRCELAMKHVGLFLGGRSEEKVDLSRPLVACMQAMSCRAAILELATNF